MVHSWSETFWGSVRLKFSNSGKMALLSIFLPFIAGENEVDGPGVGVGVDPVADVKHTLAQLVREAATISRTNEF